MAKYETELRGDFDQTLEYFHKGILDASMSASYEDESYVHAPGCAAASGCTSGTASAAATGCPWP